MRRSILHHISNATLPIGLRCKAILGVLDPNINHGPTWLDDLEHLFSYPGKGLYLCWLSITGCYPTRKEIARFKSEVATHGLVEAIDRLIRQRSSEANSAQLMLSVVFQIPNTQHLMDVTVTHSAPHLTGIQRVVKEISLASNPSFLTRFIFLNKKGVIQEIGGSEELNLSKHPRQDWQIKLIHQMHRMVPSLERNRLGITAGMILFPLARAVKATLSNSSARRRFNTLSKKPIENLLLLNRSVTVPEIPSNYDIDIYEAMLDSDIATIQCILYDFIPFFHAWTLHPSRRGELNSYLRLILLADRIVAISDLVREQAELLVKAFNLERAQWESKERRFASLPLPSGLKGTFSGEFHKRRDLVVMVGSIEPRKNHRQFFDAIEILSNRGTDIDAVILGSAGWENEEFIARLSELRSRGIRVRRLANQTDAELRSWIGTAQVVVQISEAEGYGLPVVESLELGTRVIVSDIRPLNEWDGPWISKVPLGDPTMLANEIEAILTSPAIDSPPPKSTVSWHDWCDLLFDPTHGEQPNS